MVLKALTSSLRYSIPLFIISCLTIFETSFASPSPSQTDTKSCVLYYERQEHPFWTEIQTVFSGHPEVALISVAKPADISRCIREHNPDEILIFAHAFEIDAQTSKLGFFLPISDEQVQNNYLQAIKQLEAEHQKIVSQKYFSKCNQGPRSVVPCSDEQKKEMSLRNTLSRLRTLKADDPLYRMSFAYQKGLIFQKPFDDLYDLIKSHQFKLKKIRLMSCEPHQIFNAYPSLKKIVEEQGIELDIAPKSTLLSWIYGKEITTIDSDWLKLSLDGAK